MNSDNAITPAPGKDKKSQNACILLIFSSTHGNERSERSVQMLNQLSQLDIICSRTLAVTQLNNDLTLFLQWYNSSNNMPNITSLAMSGLPTRRGRKGGVAKRFWDRQEKKTPKLSVPRPIFQPVASGFTGSSSSGATPTGAHCSTVRPASIFSKSLYQCFPLLCSGTD